MRLPYRIYLILLLALGGASYLHSQPRITYPNGGESFYPGQKLIIRWDGADASEIVGLEYSTDGGDSWKSITDAASGLQHTWYVPQQLPSDRCLLRITYTSGKPQIFLGHDDEILDVGFSSDERSIIAHSSRLVGLTVKDRISGETRWKVGDAEWARPNPAHNVVVTISNNTAVLRDVMTGTVIDSLSEAAKKVSHARFSPDGSMLVTVGTDGAVMLWDGESGAFRKTLGRHDANTTYLRFSRNGERVVSRGQFDGIMKVWDLKSGDLVQTIVTPVQEIVSVALNRDGTKVAAIYYGSSVARVWDVASGKELFSFPGEKLVIFSHDGSQILTGTQWEGARVYDAGSGALIQAFEEANKELVGAVYSPDGEKVALLHGEGDVTLWDVRTGGLQKTLKGHSKLVYCAEFSKDGRYLITGSRDKTVLLWDLQGAQSGADLSDATFTIWPSTLAIFTLDLGNTPYGYRHDSTVTAAIRNPENKPLLVGNLRFGGADSTSFSLIGGMTSLEVPAGGSADLAVRFIPAAARAHQAVLQFDAHGMGYQLQLRGNGVKMDLVPQVDAIDFGEVPVNSTIDTTVTAVVRNMTREQMRIDSVTVLPAFYLQTPTSWRRDTVIAPGAVLGLRLTFSSNFQWSYRQPLRIFYGGRDSLTIFAIAESVLPASVSYQAEDGSESVVVQPNPARDWVEASIRTDGPGIVRASVRDLLGVVHKEEKLQVPGEGEHHLRMNISDLPSGRYLLVIDSPSGNKSVPLSIVR